MFTGKGLSVAVNITPSLSLTLARGYPTPLITSSQQGFPPANALHSLLGKMLLNTLLNLHRGTLHTVMKI